MGTIDQACGKLREGLKSGVWIAGQRLPSLSALARECGVSRTTMWKAAAILQQESLIHANRGGAIIAGPRSATGITTRIPDNAGLRLKSRIGRDIHNGVLVDQRFPPMNKMALSYGVAIDTLKKALDQLVREGLLKRVGRAFHQIDRHTLRYHRSIVLITASDKNGEISISGDYRTEQVLNSYERECLRSGFSPRCEGFSYSLPNAVLELSDSLRGISDTTGYIVNLWKPWVDLLWQRWLDLLGFLTSRKLPVIIIDQTGTLTLPKELYERNNLRILHLAGVRAGEQVGQALLNTGYRNVAYLQHSDFDWAHLRYAGLLRYFEQYGGQTAHVESIALNDNTTDDDLMLAFLNLDPAGITDLFKERFTRGEIDDFLARFQNEKWLQIRKKIPSNTETKTIQLIAKFLLSLARQGHDRWIFDQEFATLRGVASGSARDWHLKKLFRVVLEKSAATAWVCPNDQIAIAALAFLRAQGKKVPGEISVIGFNNWRDAHEHQLSSFDFNMDGMVQLSMQLIMDEKAFKGRPIISEVDGYVVERRTTRR